LSPPDAARVNPANAARVNPALRRGKPMPDPAIDAVLLDAGGVLMLPDHERILEALAPLELAVDATRLDRAHYAGIRGHDAHPPGPAEWRGYLEAYAQTLEVPETRLEGVVRALFAAFAASERLWRRPIASSVPALRELSRRGVRLGVVSNADGTVEARLRELAICQVGAGPGVPVEVVIDSHCVGVEKPDPAIFDFALRAMDLDPARCLYVGDSVRNDVLGSRAAGLVPVLMDPEGLHPAGDHARVRGLDELLDLVLR
jgi:putative hydrolase of the HAD superfamily